MPYASLKQRAYIYAAARRGEAWAIRFIAETEGREKAERVRGKKK